MAKELCKICEDNPMTHDELGLCDECYEVYLDNLASAEEWETHHGAAAEEIHENSSNVW
jgi:hypothetical protein